MQLSESFIGNIFDLHQPQNQTFHSIPDCHEGEPEEKAERAPKLRHERLEGVDQDLFLNLGVLRNRPEAKHHLVFWIVHVVVFFGVGVDKLILLVTARPFAAGHVHNLRQRRIGQVNVESLKSPENIECKD